MDPRFGEFLRNELAAIREQGLFKEEWPILGPQGAEIRVEGRAEPVLNFCANNYLGLSGHPELLAAAHRALDEWGYGMSSVRFICGTQALHLELEKRIARVPRHGGRDPVRRLLRRQRRRLRAPARRRRRDPHRQAEPRLDHRRRAPVQGEALRLRARRHGRPRGEARGGAVRALPADRDRRRLLDGRRHRAARRRSATWPTATGPCVLVDDSPRHRLHGQDRARHLRALRRGGPGRHHHHHLRQGARRRARAAASRARAEVDRPAAPAQPALPLLEHAARRSWRARPCAPSSCSRRAPSCATGSRPTRRSSASG